MSYMDFVFIVTYLETTVNWR